MGRHDRQPAPPVPVASPAAPLASVAPPPAPRFVAKVRIFAGHLGEFAPGDEIPEAVALDGLTVGEHFTRE